MTADGHESPLMEPFGRVRKEKRKNHLPSSWMAVCSQTPAPMSLLDILFKGFRRVRYTSGWL